MHLKNSDILVAFGIVLLNVVELLLPYTLLWVSILLALPLVFFVPGYMLTTVLTHTRRLNVFHCLTFSLGLSLTIDILAGFLLNVLPIGLRTQSWVVLLSCITLLFGLAILYLRRRIVYVSVQEDRRSTAISSQGARKGTPLPYDGSPNTTSYMGGASPCGRPGPLPRSIFWIRDGIVFALAITLVILSLIYATRSVAEGSHVGFTQLWMLPPSHKAQTCVVNVGIHSFENGPAVYHAIVTMNSVQKMSWSMLTLAPNQLWERSIIITSTTTKTMFVEMRLYRNDRPTVVYREVHMTLMVLVRGKKIVSCG